MEYIIVGLLVVIIILLIVLLTRKNNSELNEKLSRTEINVIKEISEFKHNFSNELNKDFNSLNDRIEYKLNLINQKVNEKLEDGFDKTNKTFTEVMNRLTRIDEAQKKIDGLGNEIVSLESILTDKKSRGIFGEVNLYHILSSIFGRKGLDADVPGRGIAHRVPCIILRHTLQNGVLHHARGPLAVEPLPHHTDGPQQYQQQQQARCHKPPAPAPVQHPAPVLLIICHCVFPAFFWFFFSYSIAYLPAFASWPSPAASHKTHKYLHLMLQVCYTGMNQ